MSEVSTSILAALLTVMFTGCEPDGHDSTSAISDIAKGDWEALLPSGAETDLVKLNLAAGNKSGADYIQSGTWNLKAEMKPFTPDGFEIQSARY